MLGCFVVLLMFVMLDHEITDVDLCFYRRSYYLTQKTSLDDPLALLSFPGFDFDKPTVFYIHGYLEQPSFTSVQSVIEAYIERGDYNIILVDWSRKNGFPYFLRAAPNALRLGLALGRALSALSANGLDLMRVHIVGHSTGAHVAGLAARSQENLVGRVTGLDPAGPGWYGFGLQLNANDADFVDVIHTDAGWLGTAESIGMVDFWPNRGVRQQPGCSFFLPFFAYPILEPDVCSHWRSWRFWVESLMYEKSFPARRCAPGIIKLPNLTEPEITYMGNAARKGLRDDFCLITREESPFGYATSQTTFQLDKLFKILL